MSQTPNENGIRETKGEESVSMQWKARIKYPVGFNAATDLGTYYVAATRERGLRLGMATK